MAPLVFDIETKNIFSDVGGNDPTLLDISVVGVYDYAQDFLHAYEEHEFKDMWPLFEKADALVGYNSDHFDIPLLDKYYPGNLTAIPSIDIMKSIKDSLGRRVKLQDIAEATLGIGKSADGLQATRWWKEGKKEEVKKYCLQDVLVTRDLFDYAKKNKHVKLHDGTKIITIPLSTDTWEQQGGHALTHALPF